MGKLGRLFAGIQGFLGEVRVELSKCTWPTRPELIESTIVVIVSCLILASYVGFSDFVLMALTSVVIR
jgi:preprotein translocase subunit SecE